MDRITQMAMKKLEERRTATIFCCGCDVDTVPVPGSDTIRECPNCKAAANILPIDTIIKEDTLTLRDLATAALGRIRGTLS